MKKILPNPMNGGLPCTQIDVPNSYQLTEEEQASGWELMTPETFSIWQIAKQRELAQTQKVGVVLDRLTDAETRALMAAQSSNQVAWKYLAKANAVGTISSDNPDFIDARDYLDKAGIIEFNRWDDLLAP